MAPSKLNPAAPVFWPSAWASGVTDPEYEANLSEAELEELEAAESWVDLMADMEMQEEEFLIDLALRYAPDEIEAIERREALSPA